jgi:ABC-type bacteriocin/lantibiotic exporter with double-glycine peptidase domain
MIYGKSGSGKSTLIKILLKYINNYGGSVYINNRNLNDINQKIINNSFTYVSQNEKLFSDTVINNILLNRNISNRKLEIILNITKVNKIIDRKKFRYMHLIEENGFNLSGGERQKIILARALIKNSNYLILDEALSEVGIDEEIEIIKNLKDKTIIYISHKHELLDLFEHKYMFCQKGETC